MLSPEHNRYDVIVTMPLTIEARSEGEARNKALMFLDSGTYARPEGVIKGVVHVQVGLKQERLDV